MIHKVLIISIFLLCISCSSQESKIPHAHQGTMTQAKPSSKNLSYERQLAELYNIFRIAQSAAVPKETLDSAMGLVTDPRLSLTKEIVAQYTQRVPDFINDKFLSKPDRETMDALYYLYIIGVDAFINGAADPVGVIKKGVPSDFVENDLLVNYYRIIFTRMHRVTGVQDYSNYSIDFNRLSLNSPEEKAILLYVTMSYFGAKYNRLGKNNCRSAKAFADSMPLYEGNKFYEYNIPDYKSVMVYRGQSKVRKPLKEAYGASFDAAIKTYRKCN